MPRLKPEGSRTENIIFKSFVFDAVSAKRTGSVVLLKMSGNAGAGTGAGAVTDGRESWRRFVNAKPNDKQTKVPRGFTLITTGHCLHY